MALCFFCGQELNIEGKVLRRDECPHCRRDVHACVQCRFYDPHAHNQCREPQAEWAPDKEKANFCGYFVFSGRERTGAEPAVKARKALEDLFKK